MGSYHNLEINKIVKETEDTVSLTLKSTDGKPHSFLPGQFLTFLFDEDGEEVRRGFSISSTPDDLPFLRITIKKVHQNSTSTHCIANAKVGQVLKSLPPLGNFSIVPDKNLEREFIMFGAGSGITPLFSMLKSILVHEEKSKVILFYGNRNEDSIIFKQELEELTKKYPDRFNLIHVLSKPNKNWDGFRGRITKEFASEQLSSLKNVNAKTADYYLCGPEGMMQNVLAALDEFKIDNKKIHRESFVVKIIDEHEEVEQIEREVTIFIKGKKNTVIIKPDESILQKALSLGLQIPNSCQIGECGTCRARLLSGKLKLVSQTALSEQELNDGYCLTCVGYPASDNVVILYEDPFED
jgi:ring-1,2-phenylacetyl-CoA epoxidase subunit PaaE